MTTDLAQTKLTQTSDHIVPGIPASVLVQIRDPPEGLDKVGVSALAGTPSKLIEKEAFAKRIGFCLKAS